MNPYMPRAVPLPRWFQPQLGMWQAKFLPTEFEQLMEEKKAQEKANRLRKFLEKKAQERANRMEVPLSTETELEIAAALLEQAILLLNEGMD